MAFVQIKDIRFYGFEIILPNMAAMAGLSRRLFRSIRLLPSLQGWQAPVTIRFVSQNPDGFPYEFCCLHNCVGYLYALVEAGRAADLQRVYGIQSRVLAQPTADKRALTRPVLFFGSAATQ